MTAERRGRLRPLLSLCHIAYSNSCQYIIDKSIPVQDTQCIKSSSKEAGMTIWLKRARKMCGYTSRQLADMTGYKLNTIQRIEGGSRRFEGEARALICRALSLSPETAPLDFELLLQKVDDLIDQDGEGSFCLSVYVWRNSRRILLDCLHWDDSLEEGIGGRDAPYPEDFETTPLRLRYARKEVEAVIAIYDNPCVGSEFFDSAEQEE